MSRFATPTVTLVKPEEEAPSRSPAALLAVLAIILAAGVNLLFVIWHLPAVYTHYMELAGAQGTVGVLVPALYSLMQTLIRLAASLVFLGFGILFIRHGPHRGMALLASAALVCLAAPAAVPYFAWQSRLYVIFSDAGSILLAALLVLFPARIGSARSRWLAPTLVAMLAAIRWIAPSRLQFVLYLLIGMGLLAILILHTARLWRSRAQDGEAVVWPVVVFTVAAALFGLRMALLPLLVGIWPDGSAHLLLQTIDLVVVTSLAALPLPLLVLAAGQRLWGIVIVLRQVHVSTAADMLAVFPLLNGFLLGQQVLVGWLGEAYDVLIVGTMALLAGLLFDRIRRLLQDIIGSYVFRPRFDLDELRRARTMADMDYGALSGQEWEGYILEEVLGRGGMAEVYKAYHESGHTIAIKVLHAMYLYNTENLKRFDRESQAAAQIAHPNIVSIHAIGDIDGLPCMVMDYIEGEDLRSVIRRGQYDYEDIVRWMDNVCSALDAAHARGYIHRDLKPSNIMIRSDSVALLMDFGIAKFRHSTTDITNSTIGTIDYMAPEQIQEASTIDQRADIYGLGIVLYELLTGNLPFEGSVAQVMFAHLSQDAPDPRVRRPEIPTAFAQAVMRALQRDPRDRYHSAGELAEALRG